MTKECEKSYSSILKSTSLIGGAQGIKILIRIIRVKFVAVLIGPVGLGLVGTYRSMIQLVGTIAGLGLKSSAVRDIAEAVSSGEEQRVGQTVLTLRRMCWLTGSIGSVTVALLSRKLSLITFNTPDYALDISLVGLTILFTNVQGGQMALIQGMRRIGDLAKLSVFGTAVGSVVSVGLYAVFGKEGIVPAIVSLGVIQTLASWWFARKIKIPRVTMNWRESFKAAGGMVKLGLAFMWSGTLVAVVAYTTRILIVHEIDLVAVGIFSAAFSLSGLVVNFVLGAMGADYYPSLTAVNTDHERMRTLVNQQTEIGLLLAMPGLLGTLALAPWAIKVFYTAEFWQAADLLQWFALGCLGRVISWPMGFILLAKGARKLFVLTETIAHIFHIGLIWWLLNWIGIEGVSISFFILYFFHTILMLIVSRYLIGFSWSSGVLKLLATMFPVVIGTFMIGKLLSDIPATMIGLFITMGTTLFCLRGLISRLASDHKICRLIRKIPYLI